MRKLTMTLTAAALMLGTMAIAANAQTQAPGAAGLHTQIQNATPIKQAACRGFGRWCPPGSCGAVGRIGAGAPPAGEPPLSDTTIARGRRWAASFFLAACVIGGRSCELTRRARCLSEGVTATPGGGHEAFVHSADNSRRLGCARHPRRGAKLSVVRAI